jgi:hypothetical protein
MRLRTDLLSLHNKMKQIKMRRYWIADTLYYSTYCLLLSLFILLTSCPFTQFCSLHLVYSVSVCGVLLMDLKKRYWGDKDHVAHAWLFEMYTVWKQNTAQCNIYS